VYAVNKADVNQSNIWLVGLGTERRNPDYSALSVMNQVFSGGFGSRLFQSVRTKLGLAYSVDGAYSASYDHPGLFYVVAATKSQTTVEAANAMLAQVRDLKTQPFTEQELSSAKDQVLNSFVFHYDTKEKILAERAKLEFYGYPEDFLEKYHDAVEKVSTADLERVAKKYIDPGKLAVLVVGNESQFTTPLSTLGPVHPIDITIPMPPGMQSGGPGDN
jgi:zinc protease